MTINRTTSTACNLPEWISHPERQIIARIVTEALARNLAVSVYDGEEWSLTASTNRAQIEAEIAATDCTTLRFRETTVNAEGKANAVVGSVFLVHGNGCDVITDYTDNERTEAILAPALELAELYNNATN